jgi:peptidylprolyl isomerase
MDTTQLADGLYAIMHTDKGDITLALEYRKSDDRRKFVGLAEGSLNLRIPAAVL